MRGIGLHGVLTSAEFLSGKKALGVNPTSASDWDALIRAGVPVRSVGVLREGVAVPDNLLAELLGVREKTLSRARAGKGGLDPVTNDRLFRVARIVTLAIEVLASGAGALHWLKQPLRIERGVYIYS